MPKIIDITGQRFGRLVAIERSQNVARTNAPSRPAWLCACDCGTRKVVSKACLISGLAKSCGCIRREVVSAKNTSHGMSKTPEYISWGQMNRRCHDMSNKNYKDYGGRGISVCEQWRHSFENFFSSMGRRPTIKHSLERKDNSLGYSPGNCKWATRREQSQNRRGRRYLSAFGTTLPVEDWGHKISVRPKTILARIDRLGWPVSRAVSEGLNQPICLTAPIL